MINAVMATDQERWNAKYRAGEHDSSEPSLLVAAIEPLLPRTGFALDLAGGAGRHSLWLAERGLTVTLADISDVALAMARERAARRNLPLRTVPVDLAREPIPDGPWDLILSVHFLWRPLFQVIPSALARSGLFICIQPTRSNLQRHSKPPARFLLEDGELPRLAAGLKIVKYEEGWLAEGRHEAVLVASNDAVEGAGS